MKFTLGWLKDHLETEASLAKIVETLIRIGLEVDKVEDPGSKLDPFITAQVTDVQKHPDADRLKICKVDTGSEQVQVVCGAPNARVGMIGVFAPAGSWIPGLDFKLKAAEIRGVKSNGMLVSEREMELSDDHEGIIELPEETIIGKPFASILGIDDPIIDIELTPNRPDCTGVRGIARDLAAAGLGRLKPSINSEPIEGTYDSPFSWSITSDDNACSYVVGRHFKGITNRPSPKWLQNRLNAIGLRPISALVDITNYIAIDLGRPLHVFDSNKLNNKTLTMRRAKSKEPFFALIDKHYKLDESKTVIGDGDKVAALAGVMGGMDSSCLPETTEVFLEVALFDPVQVATTGRAMQIESDARYRFERGVDPQSAEWGAEAAAHMILNICGGEASKKVSAGSPLDASRLIELRPDRVKTLGGIEVAIEEQIEILEKLGFLINKGTKILVSPPTWRPDIHGEADLVEEITRIIGFEKIIPISLAREQALPSVTISPRQKRYGIARRTLAAEGLEETVTWSFMGSQHADIFGGVDESLYLSNPISSDLDVLRPSIIPNLVLAAGRNMDRGLQNFGLFELGPAYQDATPEGQLLVATGIRQGNIENRNWSNSSREVDAIDAKGDALATLEAAEAPIKSLKIVTNDIPEYYHPGRSASFRLGNNILAWFGELHPSVLQKLDISSPLVGFEVFLDRIPIKKKRKTARPPLKLSPLQAVYRDLAFIFDEDYAADNMIAIALSVDDDLIENVRLFDVYTGKGIEKGKKSLAIEVMLQPRKETLTEEQIDDIIQKIVLAITNKTGGVLRS